MSVADTEEQLRETQDFFTSLLDADKGRTDYNEETDTDKDNQNNKSQDKTTSENKLSHTFIRYKRFYLLLLNMYNAVKEVAIIFSLFLIYAALTNDPPKISKSPPAVPFFSKSSVVQDWYRGELSAALAKARQSDISFIMFYAPWDAECQAVRYEFDLAARYMKNHVTFLAVNCWQPGSECRSQNLKAFNWPILIAYLRGKGIHYKGINTAPYMVKFLIGLTKPFIRIYEERDVHDVHALNDAVVLGCISALPGSIDYSMFYNAAINVLESDPTREIPFLLLTGVNNSCVDHHNNSHALVLHLWNETLWYPNVELWKSGSILLWIQTHLHQVTAWAAPSGTKSSLLSLYLQPGPTLVLFTPKNPLDTSDYYNLLREVALEYNNCNENVLLKMNSLLIYSRRIENYLKYRQHLQECKLIREANKQEKAFQSVVTYTIPKEWVNNSCSKCDPSSMLKDRFPSYCEQHCSDSYHQLGANSNIYKSCENASQEKLREADGKFNPKLPSNLQKLGREEKCRKFRFAQKLHPSVFSDTIDNFNLKKQTSFARCTGLACKINTTLSFIALDSLQHYHFAERLGVDLSTRKDRTAAVIVNEQVETHHIMVEPVNDETLRQFVINFTNGNLPRAFNSNSDIKSTYTHSYSHKKACDIKDSSTFCLTELDSTTFLPTVLQQEQVVVVLYYSKQCSFCSGISYTFLAVAKMLSSMSSIKFVRIDGDLNSLPWEFTMERYPTILFFPFRRKSETRVFPQNMPVTVSNLVSFLLANLNQTIKLHVMWTLCDETKLEEDRQMCISATRTENLSLIGRTLRAWRSADVLRKSKLLYKLQQLRNINLLLAIYPLNSNDVGKYLSQLHWSIHDQLIVNSVNSQPKFIKDEL